MLASRRGDTHHIFTLENPDSATQLITRLMGAIEQNHPPLADRAVESLSLSHADEMFDLSLARVLRDSSPTETKWISLIDAEQIVVCSAR